MNKRPRLTFPLNVADEVRSQYQRSKVILEYGSGGSTILASEFVEKTIFSVESDQNWTKSIESYIRYSKPPSTPIIHYVNVGKTGLWGRPVDKLRWKSFPEYSLSVWDLKSFRHPDVILIDGRFRVGCFLSCALRVAKKTTVLFDDYANRSSYHTVEKIFKPVRMTGRMAIFELLPGKLTPEHQLWFIRSLYMAR